MDVFIYVFNKYDKKVLEDFGLILLKEDEAGAYFIFDAGDDKNYPLPDSSYVVSNTLSF